nr:MAG TPA: hypothetical protein [Caudoviricetes sp.]
MGFFYAHTYRVLECKNMMYENIKIWRLPSFPTFIKRLGGLMM